jgi:TrkA domain protein
MPDVRETNLPGIGVRHDFTAADGTRIGVLVRRDGRREILVYDRKDPDACSARMQLSASDTQTMSELLGAGRVTEAVSAVRQQIEGLAIEWVDVGTTSPLLGHTIADGELRTRTGASVVAVIRGDTTVPAPGPDFVFEPRDVVVAVGTDDGLATLRSILGPPPGH